MAEYIERTEEVALAMNAGARAIENTKRYHGAIYSIDVFSRRERRIPYSRAAEVLRTASMSSAADVAPVVHGRWEKADWIELSSCGELIKTPNAGLMCGNCRYCFERKLLWVRNCCPNCGARMDGGEDDGDGR